MELFEFTLATIKYFIAGLLALVVFFYVLIPLFRGLREPLDYPELHQGLPGGKSITEQELEIEIPQGESAPTDKKIIQIASKDPKKTAQVIRRWLSDGKHG